MKNTSKTWRDLGGFIDDIIVTVMLKLLLSLFATFSAVAYSWRCDWCLEHCYQICERLNLFLLLCHCCLVTPPRFLKKTTCLPFSLNPVGFVEDLVTARATRLFYLSGVSVVDIFSQP